MEWLIPYLALSGLVLALAIGWLLTLLGMPGTWLMVGVAALFAWAVPAEGPFRLSWVAVGVLVALASLGELVEFFAGAYGAGRLGASRRGVVLSIVGSMAGALTGAIVGVPIPVIGSLLGALAFGCVGALVGTVIGELWKGRPLSASMTIGEGAFWGRLWGTVLKTAIAAVMVAVGIAAAVF